jgi:transposase-like protein
VEGQGTLAETADRHGVPEQTLVAWYRRDNWTASRNRWLEKQLSGNDTPRKPPAAAALPENSADASRAHKLQRLETQLDALDNVLDNAKTADEWHKLSTAKHRLLENYYVLAGIPKPGSRKPAPERQRPSTLGAFGDLGPIVDLAPDLAESAAPAGSVV